MSEIITYNLNLSNTTSDEYYENIKKIANTISTELVNEYSDFLDDYMMFQKISSHEKVRTKQEYGLEVLLIGILWNSYIEKAVSLKLSFFKNHIQKSSDSGLEYSLDNFKKLIDYLESSKEFFEEVKRLEVWHKYLYNLSDKDLDSFLKSASRFSAEFSLRCDELLCKYLPNLDSFLKVVPKNKDDIILCSKSKEQYYLNMVGAEIMNIVFLEDFRNTKEKMIILPGCMVLNKEDCQAEPTKWGNSCVGCTFNCPVNKINRSIKDYNINVYIVHHESDLYKNAQLDDDNIGIVGIACVLNLLSGGWKAKRIGLIPQCVLLDYCGCKHWHENGIVTNININELLSKIKV